MSCLEVVLPAIMSLNPTWGEAKAEKYAQPICIEAERRDIDPLIGLAVVRHETNFKPKKKSTNKNGSVDYGLMQFNCRDLDQIKMKWRRRICDPKRRRYLMSIRGNIYAGFKEMSFWKRACFKKHGLDAVLYSSVDCRDCLTVPLDPSIYEDLKEQWQLTGVLKFHWWMRHYNWNSERHWLSVMFIYKVLLEQKEEHYVLVNSDYYRRLAKKGKLKKCLMKEDTCFEEYKKWQQLRKKRKRSKKKSRT